MSIVRNKQRGSVSLFVVIFAALLIITVTVAFIRIMLQDQMQATSNDLSKSALDSAYAGVEDAKRAVIHYQQECPAGPSTNAVCDDWTDLMNGKNCDATQKVLGTVSSVVNGEVQVGNDVNLNQAYMCVNVKLDTPEYINTLLPGVSQVVPLKANKPFDTVTIEWFSRSDLDRSSVVGGTKPIVLTTSSLLKKKINWSPQTPSLMRAQLLQFGQNFTMDDFDIANSTKANTATVFMMPFPDSTTNYKGDKLDFAIDYTSGALQQVKCDSSFTSVGGAGNYGCKVALKLPLINNRKGAYLRLQTPYNAQTNYRVTLSNSSTPVLFSGVQPEVDSTGRASDLFRRVVTRIDSKNNFAYIEGALDIEGNLCKMFTVGERPEDYKPGTTCTP